MMSKFDADLQLLLGRLLLPELMSHVWSYLCVPARLDISIGHTMQRPEHDGPQSICVRDYQNQTLFWAVDDAALLWQTGVGQTVAKWGRNDSWAGLEFASGPIIVSPQHTFEHKGTVTPVDFRTGIQTIQETELGYVIVTGSNDQWFYAHDGRKVLLHDSRKCGGGWAWLNYYNAVANCLVGWKDKQCLSILSLDSLTRQDFVVPHPMPQTSLALLCVSPSCLDVMALCDKTLWVVRLDRSTGTASIVLETRHDHQCLADILVVPYTNRLYLSMWKGQTKRL